MSEQADHLEIAKRHMADGEHWQTDVSAGVHALVAIASELRDQNHWLEEIANQLSRAQQ